MREYKEWKNTPARFGTLRFSDNFMDIKREEIVLFRAEFKERPRRIITRIIVGKPDTDTISVCNALWDTGCTDTCISQTIADELDLEEYGKKTMSDMTSDRLCTFYIADIRAKDKQCYFSEERCGGIDFDGADYEAIIGMDVISAGNFRLKYDGKKWIFTFSVCPPEENEKSPFKILMR